MKLLLCPIMWPSTPAYPWSNADTQALADYVRAWYIEASYGKLVFDVTIAPWTRMATETPNYMLFSPAIVAAGISKGGILDRVVYVTPRADPPGYKGSNWGVESWCNCGGTAYALPATAHELGHSLGLNHAASLRAGNYDAASRIMSFPPPDVVENGVWFDAQPTSDASDMMSYTWSGAHFGIQIKAQLGWVSIAEGTLAEYTGGDQTYTLKPTEMQPAGGLRGVMLVLAKLGFPTSKRVYWVEYRQPIGYDVVCTGPMAGIQIRCIGAFQCIDAAGLIDARPNSQTLSDSAFQVGDQFNDGKGVAIDFVSATPTEATIRIRPTAAAPPVVPPVIPPVPVPIPPPTGNAMTIANIRTLAAALVDPPTQAQKDAIIAECQKLVVAQPAPPDPPAPPPAGTSPPGTTITHPTTASITDNTGAVWKITPWNDSQRNGVNLGLSVNSITWTGARIEVTWKDRGGKLMYWNGTKFVEV